MYENVPSSLSLNLMAAYLKSAHTPSESVNEMVEVHSGATCQHPGLIGASQQASRASFTSPCTLTQKMLAGLEDGFLR